MKFYKALTLFARTPLHVGAGNSVGAIDSPIIRERHTNVALIPGSSLKGVLADLWPNEANGKRGAEAKQIFGDDSQETFSAGELLVGEARVVAFPVRSAKNSFVWIVSPMVLQRFCRDFGKTLGIPDIKDDKYCYAPKEVCLDYNKVVLEEYLFENQSDANNAVEKVVEALKPLSGDSLWKDTLAKRLVIVSDEFFSYFIKNACEVTARIRINDTIGSVDKGALFYQEQLPSETMLYAILGELHKPCGENVTNVDTVAKIEAKVNDAGNILQIGGDATIGLGFCSVKFINL